MVQRRELLAGAMALLADPALAHVRGIGGRLRAKPSTAGVVSPVIYTADFTAGSLPAEFSASGGANGTRVNSSGLLVAATAPRFDYNFGTLTARGLLIEEARTNLVKSSAGSGAAWTDEGTSRSSAGTALDGGSAVLLAETATTATHSMFQDVGGANSQPFGTVYLQSAGRQFATICVGQNNWIIVDLTNGLVTQAACSMRLALPLAHRPSRPRPPL
jgi:hypothetical protein